MYECVCAPPHLVGLPTGPMFCFQLFSSSFVFCFFMVFPFFLSWSFGGSSYIMILVFGKEMATATRRERKKKEEKKETLFCYRVIYFILFSFISSIKIRAIP